LATNSHFLTGSSREPQVSYLSTR